MQIWEFFFADPIENVDWNPLIRFRVIEVILITFTDIFSPILEVQTSSDRAIIWAASESEGT